MKDHASKPEWGREAGMEKMAWTKEEEMEKMAGMEELAEKAFEDKMAWMREHAGRHGSGYGAKTKKMAWMEAGDLKKPVEEKAPEEVEEKTPPEALAETVETLEELAVQV
mmetsp:Transcript_38666/g.120296  ORF Transcript_38666/g.120296 Transcript_38666/m.120296 type:complete len:110 (-) Transcript_38666:105-434(-)